MKILTCKQGSSEWAAARLGVVTASEIDALVSPTWKIRTGQGVETYLYRKLAEKVMGYSGDGGGTFSMDQGNLIEKIAIPYYAFTYNVDVKTVGFCLSDDGRMGCSPDGLIGEDSGLEIKSPQPPHHLEYLLKGEVPPQYLPQIHFSMYVTQRPTWTFMSYSTSLPALVVYVKHDPAIGAVFREALASFFLKFDAALAKITALREAENAGNQPQPKETTQQ